MKKSNIIIGIGLISIFTLSALAANASTTINVTATLTKSDNIPSRTDAIKERLKKNKERMKLKKIENTNSNSAIIDPLFIKKSYKKTDDTDIIDPLFKNDTEIIDPLFKEKNETSSKKLNIKRMYKKNKNDSSIIDPLFKENRAPKNEIIDPLFKKEDRATSGATMEADELSPRETLLEKIRNARNSRKPASSSTSIIDPLFKPGETNIVDPSFKPNSTSIIDPLFKPSTTSIIDPLFREGDQANRAPNTATLPR